MHPHNKCRFLILRIICKFYAQLAIHHIVFIIVVQPLTVILPCPLEFPCSFLFIGLTCFQILVIPGHFLFFAGGFTPCKKRHMLASVLLVSARARAEEAKKPRSQEAKKPRSQEAKKPRSQEAKKPRSQEARPQTFKQSQISKTIQYSAQIIITRHPLCLAFSQGARGTPDTGVQTTQKTTTARQ